MYKTPEFDQDLYHAWLKERAAAMATMKQSHFVTLSREFGCDGYPTAMKLCDLINRKKKLSPWLVFSHAMMEQLVSGEKLTPELIDEVSEKRYRFVNWFIDGLVPDYLKSTESQVFEKMRTIILNLAEKGSCIIVGGGSQIITNTLDPEKFLGVHVRLIGTEAFRIKQAARKFSVSRADAPEYIRNKQDARDRFIEDFTGRSAKDRYLYNIILNNDKSTPDVMAQTIFSYLTARGIV